MDRSFCIAPMMARTDKHFRYLVRQLTKKAILFTEMIHTNSILFGNKDKLNEFLNIDGIGDTQINSLKKFKEFIHFGCTSEDINNLAYGLMIKEISEKILLDKVTAA